MSAPSGSDATSLATCPCSARLYSTTGGQTDVGLSEPALTQPLKKIIAITRAAAGDVQHLALNNMGALQVFQPLGDASRAFGRTAEVEQKEDDSERDEDETRQPPRPRPRDDTVE